MVSIKYDWVLQWWSMRNKYLEWFCKIGVIFLQNDIVEKYFTKERSKLHFSFYTIDLSGMAWVYSDFPTGSKQWPFVLCHFCWLIRVSLLITLGGHIVFWEMVFGSFMISRPNLSSSDWLGFVYRMLPWCHLDLQHYEISFVLHSWHHFNILVTSCWEIYGYLSHPQI